MANSTTVLSHSFDGTFYRIRTTSFDLHDLIGDHEDPGQAGNIDVEVRLPDGSRWSATMFTVAEVERLMEHWAQTGECGSGSYFWCSDGVIVREPGVSFMTEVLIGLHDEDNLTGLLKPLDNE
ncbi:hypothetical protein ACIA2T_15795 [Amycolatopsis japonica]|uniref:hypothetical protein n=1 Tax=Amycolatopsis japonica TaxID=208439 RepID=UPI0037BCEB7D